MLGGGMGGMPMLVGGANPPGGPLTGAPYPLVVGGRGWAPLGMGGLVGGMVPWALLMGGGGPLTGG